MVTVEHGVLNSSVGPIRNLFHFANLAKSNWKEAVRLFYRPEFLRPVSYTHLDVYKRQYLDFYRKVFQDYKEPLFWIHLNMDYPFNLKGILYFPKINMEYESIEEMCIRDR